MKKSWTPKPIHGNFARDARPANAESWCSSKSCPLYHGCSHASHTSSLPVRRLPSRWTANSPRSRTHVSTAHNQHFPELLRQRCAPRSAVQSHFGYPSRPDCHATPSFKHFRRRYPSAPLSQTPAAGLNPPRPRLSSSHVYPPCRLIRSRSACPRTSAQRINYSAIS